MMGRTIATQARWYTVQQLPEKQSLNRHDRVIVNLCKLRLAFLKLVEVHLSSENANRESISQTAHSARQLPFDRRRASCGRAHICHVGKSNQERSLSEFRFPASRSAARFFVSPIFDREGDIIVVGAQGSQKDSREVKNHCDSHYDVISWKLLCIPNSVCAS